jgi:NADH-quinone oxidoreductase subunit H
VGVVVLTGSLSFTEIVEWQRAHGWGFLWQIIGFPIFLIAAAAEINRAPFDMIEADSEIVAGPFTEYSGMRFGFFFFAEYVALFVMSSVLVTLFLGGYLAPWPFPAQLDGLAGTLYGLFWFMLKTYIFVFIAVWVRATLPRVRVDQLMGMSWKVLPRWLLINLFVTAAIVWPQPVRNERWLSGLRPADGNGVTLQPVPPKVTLSTPRSGHHS